MLLHGFLWSRVGTKSFSMFYWHSNGTKKIQLWWWLNIICPHYRLLFGIKLCHLSYLKVFVFDKFEKSLKRWLIISFFSDKRYSIKSKNNQTVYTNRKQATAYQIVAVTATRTWVEEDHLSYIRLRLRKPRLEIAYGLSQVRLPSYLTRTSKHPR